MVGRAQPAGYHVWYWWMQYSDLKNNSSSHMALSQLFKWVGLKDWDNDVLWDLDKILEKLCQARKELKGAQKKHRENRDAGLKEDLEEKEKKAQESDDPKVAKKAAAAVDALIRKHRMQESYSRIKYVSNPVLGVGFNVSTFPRGMMKATWWRMEMGTKFERYFWRHLTFTKQFLKETRSIATRLWLHHLVIARRTVRYLIWSDILGWV